MSTVPCEKTTDNNPPSQTLIKEHGKYKSVLIFVPTRQATTVCAKALAEEYAGLRQSAMRLPWPPSKLQNSTAFEAPDLAATVPQGVAFHHAGLSMK
jgi:replicative superfamily II helicase